MGLLCQRCGFPDCHCAACEQTSGHGNAKAKHTCWLCSYGPHPLQKHVDPIMNRRVPPEHQQARAVAWHHVHSTLPQALQWDGECKVYRFSSSKKRKREEEEEEKKEAAAGEAEEGGHKEEEEEEEEAGGSEQHQGAPPPPPPL